MLCELAARTVHDMPGRYGFQAEAKQRSCSCCQGLAALESVSLLLIPIVRVPLIGLLHCASFAVQAAEGFSHPPRLIGGTIALRW